jgi:hypothetical protein
MSKSQVKSKERVANHGEVYTSFREVNAMLDLVKQETERIDSRFLEPACGTGNFLAEILNRKLSIVSNRYKKNQIEYEKYSIIAVSSLYGVDILEDNVIECRHRLFNIFFDQYKILFNDLIKDECNNSISYLLSKNIIWGNALTLRTVGEKPSPIVFSEWSAVNSNKIKRRDFIMEHLVNTYSLIDPEPNLFSDMGDNVAIPKAVKEFTPIYFLRLPDVEQQ